MPLLLRHGTETSTFPGRRDHLAFRSVLCLAVSILCYICVGTSILAAYWELPIISISESYNDAANLAGMSEGDSERCLELQNDELTVLEVSRNGQSLIIR